MKRHDVCGILPFIAAGVLGGAVLADGQTEITHNPNPVKGSFGGGVAGGCGPDSQTQSTDPLTIVPGNSVSCNAAGLHTDNSYFREFLAEVPFEICSVAIGIEGATAGDGVSQPMTINIYGGGLGGAVVATADFDVADAAAVVVDFPISASVDGLYAVEIFTPDGQDAGNSFFIGSNPNGESGDSYLQAEACGIAVPTPVAEIGFPGMNIVMTVNGTFGEGGNNDFCDEATTIFGDGAYEFDNTGAGAEADAWDCGSAPQDTGDLWWEYTVPADGVLTVDTCGSSFDTVLQLHDGFGCGPAGSIIACNDDSPNSPCGDTFQSEISLTVFEGDLIKIRVAGWAEGEEGPGVLNLAFEQDTGAPANDLCADAIGLAINEIAVGDTTFATLDDAPFCGVSVDSPGVWYTVVGNGNELTASLCNNTSYDAKLHVYCGSCEDLGCVGGDDDGCGVGGGPSTVTFCSVNGDTYFILVEGWEGSVGEYELQVTSGAACDNPICGSGNFACETAAAINAGDVVDDNTCDGAVAVGAPICPGGQTNLAGKWYVYTGDGNTATVSTCGSALVNFDLDVDIYCAGPEGNECAALECTEALFSPCNLFFQDFDFCTVAGNTYYIHVYGVQPGGFDECGDYQIAVSSDGAPCEDFTACDAPGCADPTAGSNVLGQVNLVGPSVLGVTQDPNTGIIYALQLFDRTIETFLYNGGGVGGVECPDTNGDNTINVEDLVNVILDWDTDGSANNGDVNGSGLVDVEDLVAVILAWGDCPVTETYSATAPPFTFDPDFTAIPETLGPPFASGLTYDNVNGTLWIMVAQDNAGAGWTMYEVDLSGAPTGNTISDPAFGGLAADVEHDAVTDTFWYVDIVADQVHNVNRAGAELNVVPQSCLAVGGDGVFGNGCDVSNGVLEVLVGELTSETGTADRAVPISTVDGSTLGDCSFGCSSVTSIVTESTFTSGICRDRLVPGVMHVVASGGDLMIAVEAAPQPAP